MNNKKIIIAVMVDCKLTFKYVVSYSYARNGSIKPRLLNKISFTKIRIQSTPKKKSPFTTWAIGSNGSTNEQTCKQWTRCSVRVHHNHTYTIQIQNVSIYLHAMRCNVCMGLWFHVYYYFIGLGMWFIVASKKKLG